MSSIIIRLQRLPWSATAQDIREFFKGLIIPEGGVHIVGGRDGDAFIAFGSDEDARQAMQMDSKRIKENKIKLMLSSRVEMQKIIEKARNEYVSDSPKDTAEPPPSRRRSRSRDRDPRRERRSPSPVRERSRRSRSPVDRRGNHKTGQSYPEAIAIGRYSVPQPLVAAVTGIIPQTDRVVSGYQSFPAGAPPPVSVASPPAYQVHAAVAQVPSSGDVFPRGSIVPQSEQKYVGSVISRDVPSEHVKLDSYTSVSAPYGNGTYTATFNAPVSAQSGGSFVQSDRDPRFSSHNARMPSTQTAEIGRPYAVPEAGAYKAEFAGTDQLYVGSVAPPMLAGPKHGLRPEEGYQGGFANGYPPSQSREMSAAVGGLPPGYSPQGAAVSAPPPHGYMAQQGIADPGQAPPQGYNRAPFEGHPPEAPKSDYSATYETGTVNRAAVNPCQLRPRAREPLLKSAPPPVVNQFPGPPREPCPPGPGFMPPGGPPGQQPFFGNPRMPPHPRPPEGFDPNMFQGGPPRSMFGPRPGVPTGPTPLFPSPITSCVRVSNIPQEYRSYGNLREFFEPIDLSGRDKIKIVTNQRGERIDVAFIMFRDPTDMDAALRLDGRFGMRIEPCAEREFLEVGEGPNNMANEPAPRWQERGGDQRPRRGRMTPPTRDMQQQIRTPVDDAERNPNILTEAENKAFIVLLENTPFVADQQDVQDFLGQSNVKALQVVKERCPDKPAYHTGRVFAELSSERDMMAVLRLDGWKFRVERKKLVRNCIVKSSSAVELFQCTGARPLCAAGGAPSMPGPAASDVKFDSGFNTRRRDSVKSSPPIERPDVTARGSSNNDRFDGPSSAGASPCVVLSGLPLNITERDIISFFGGLRIAANGLRILSEPKGVAYVEFVEFSDAEAALRKNKLYIGSRPVTVELCSRDDILNAVRRQHQQNTGSGNFNGGGVPGNNNVIVPSAMDSQKPFVNPALAPTSNGPIAKRSFLLNRPELSPPHNNNNSFAVNSIPPTDMSVPRFQVAEPPPGGLTLEQRGMPPSRMVLNPEDVLSVGKPGCVLAMHNLPPGICLEELEGFLAEYALVQDSVMMHYDNTGTPTGDCLVAVKTPENAIRAAKELDGKLLQGRAIVVYVAPSGRS